VPEPGRGEVADAAALAGLWGRPAAVARHAQPRHVLPGHGPGGPHVRVAHLRAAQQVRALLRDYWMFVQAAQRAMHEACHP
jgi:hypothetical protein